MENEQIQNVRLQLKNGNISAAIRECLELLESNEKDFNAWWLLGEVYASSGAYKNAETCYQKIVELEPGSFAGYCYLGLTRAFQGRPEAALKPLMHAVAINPDFAPGYDYLGCAYRDLGRYDEAIKAYQKALEINPRLDSAKLNMGNLLTNLGLLDQAMDIYEQILHVDAAHADALAGKAAVLEKQGLYGEAFLCVRGLIDQGVINQISATVFANLSVRFGCQDEAVSVLEKVLDMPGLATVQTRELLFSLGRLQDQLEHYERAFAAYKQANEIIPNTFDTDTYTNQVNAVIRYFTRDRLEVLASAENDSRRPVFIVGMPRSGTSLVEQVLASHPDVYGAGELDNIAELAGKVAAIAGEGLAFPLTLGSCDRESMNSLANEYLDYLAELSPDAIRVTDKMPGNYLYLGLIQLLFPGARIIHCMRDPVDTCLSCYFQSFGVGHLYSNDLGKLGEVYNCYKKLMRHWTSVLTIPVYQLNYEDMVGNFESVAHELTDFCDIAWDDRCRDFHKSGRMLNTASYNQVRQPIYRRSVHRWKFYEKYISELLDALEKEYV